MSKCCVGSIDNELIDLRGLKSKIYTIYKTRKASSEGGPREASLGGKEIAYYTRSS